MSVPELITLEYVMLSAPGLTVYSPASSTTLHLFQTYCWAAVGNSGQRSFTALGNPLSSSNVFTERPRFSNLLVDGLVDAYCIGVTNTDLIRLQSSHKTL